MKTLLKISIVAAALTASAFTQAAGWKFDRDQNQHQDDALFAHGSSEKVAAVVGKSFAVDVGCYSVTPSQSGMFIRISGPRTMDDAGTSAALQINGKRYPLKMAFVSNAEGWIWQDDGTDWRSGLYQALESGKSLKVTMLGTTEAIPMTGAQGAMAKLRQACN